MFAVGLEDLLNEPAIWLRIRVGCAVGRSEDGRSLLIESEDGSIVRLSRYVSHYDAAIDGIARGAPLAELRDSVVASGGEWNAMVFLDQLRVLCRTGFVEYPLVENGTEYAVIAPQRASYVPSLAARTPPIEDRLEPFEPVCGPSGDAWLVESPLCGARLVLADLSALDAPLVRRCSCLCWIPARSAGREWFSPRRSEAVGISRPAISHAPTPGLASRRCWVHTCLSSGRSILRQQSVRVGRGERIRLPRAPVDSGMESFASVLERRRSVRRFDDSRPVSLQELGALLDRSARTRSTRMAPGRKLFRSASPV